MIGGHAAALRIQDYLDDGSDIAPLLREMLNDAYDEGREEGYEMGHREGHEAGFNEGHAEGYEEGQREADETS